MHDLVDKMNGREVVYWFGNDLVDKLRLFKD